MSNLDKQINSLKPGHFATIGGTVGKGTWTTAERSGDGKRLSFVRHTENTSAVFKRMAW